MDNLALFLHTTDLLLLRSDSVWEEHGAVREALVLEGIEERHLLFALVDLVDVLGSTDGSIPVVGAHGTQVTHHF